MQIQCACKECGSLLDSELNYTQDPSIIIVASVELCTDCVEQEKADAVEEYQDQNCGED